MDTHEAILKIIDNHQGFDRRIPRTSLLVAVCALTQVDLTDRDLRRAIEHLRTTDPRAAWICSTTRGGYYKAKTYEELEAYFAQEKRRSTHILARINRQKRRAGLILAGNVSIIPGGK